MVDRYSGYAWVAQLNTTTTKKILETIEGWFYDYGWPDYIRSDGGPQFRQNLRHFVLTTASLMSFPLRTIQSQTD